MSNTAFLLANLQLGGTQRSTIRLLNHLHQLGQSVSLIAVDGTGPLRTQVAEQVEVIDLGLARASRAAFALRRVVKDRHIDTVVAMQDYVSVVAVAALHSMGVSVVVTERHDPFQVQQIQGPVHRQLLRASMWLTYRQASEIVACSLGVADATRRFLRLPSGAVSTIYNPIDAEHLRKLAACPIDDPAQLVFVGRLAPEKRVDRIIEVAALLPPWIRVDIVGDGPCRAALEQQVRSLGLANRVRFRGALYNPYPSIAQAHGLLLTSEFEGLTNVLIEALALGTTPIAIDCDHGPWEILGGGRHGILLGEFRSDTFADAALAVVEGQPVVDPASIEPFQLERISQQWIALLSGQVPRP